MWNIHVDMILGNPICYTCAPFHSLVCTDIYLVYGPGSIWWYTVFWAVVN